MSNFDKAFERTYSHEGGYANNPADSGGSTRWGITEKVARENGYKGRVDELPLETAKEIYRKYFWTPLRLEQVADVNQFIAEELFDTGVNMGPSHAGKFLQRGLNVLNRGGTLYGELKVDGVIGNGTLAALHALPAKDHEALLTILNGLQCARYVEICEGRPKDRAFIRGWLQRVGL